MEEAETAMTEAPQDTFLCSQLRTLATTFRTLTNELLLCSCEKEFIPIYILVYVVLSVMQRILSNIFHDFG